MRIFLFSILLSLILSADTSWKDMLDDSNTFLEGGIIYQNIDNYDNTQALHLSYSYMNFNRWGVDVGFSQSFYKGKNKTTGEERNFSSAYLFTSYLVPLNSSLGFKSKVGYARNESSEDGLGYGVELIIQMNQRSGFSFGFQKMNKHINYFIINTVYKLN
ncbi:MAG: hypothetical protein GXO60_07080 [Epsilonproteobacteria bacterium]|nr:hypothetical protein [Campylobacterota bacterium]